MNLKHLRLSFIGLHLPKGTNHPLDTKPFTLRKRDSVTRVKRGGGGGGGVSHFLCHKVSKSSETYIHKTISVSSMRENGENMEAVLPPPSPHRNLYHPQRNQK